MVYNYDLLPEARLELYNILDYYENINPNLKTAFLHEYITLVTECATILNNSLHIEKFIEKPGLLKLSRNTILSSRYTLTSF